MESDTRSQSVVDSWLQPLPDPDEPCGKDVEYDNAFLDLVRLSQGKPETQFGPGEPPNWREVRESCETLMARTRDLRVALLWVRSGLYVNGFPALEPGLRLLRGLLENFWEQLHPLPDPEDGDPYGRANVLAMLPEIDGLLGDVRQSVLFKLRGADDVRVRAVAIAFGQASARDDEAAATKDQLGQMAESAVEQSPGLRQQPQAALEEIQSLGKLMREKFGAAVAPDVKPLLDLLKGVVGIMPVADDPPVEVHDALAPALPGSAVAKASLGNVTSRDDALRAIDMVCAYLERTEPTNPAQLMLRRARKLINHSFLQLIKELAPDALSEAARVMGVDPESVSLDNDS